MMLSKPNSYKYISDKEIRLTTGFGRPRARTRDGECIKRNLSHLRYEKEVQKITDQKLPIGNCDYIGGVGAEMKLEIVDRS